MFDFKRNLAVIIGINDYENVTPFNTTDKVGQKWNRRSKACGN